MKRLLSLLAVLLLTAVKLAPSLALLLLCGVALAQSPDLPSGIPAEYQPLVTLVAGLLAGLLVAPITAVCKRLGRTQGVTTVAISGAVSVLIAFGFTLAQAAAARQDLNVWAVLLTALLAFLKANGDYLTRVFSTAKGNADLPAAQGLLGLPVGGGTELERLLASPLVYGLIRLALQGAGVPVTGPNIMQVAARLLPIAPDLLDGEPRLSDANLARINNAVLDLTAGGHK